METPGHLHHHHDHHEHHGNVSSKRLLAATVLNFLIALVEIIGGVVSNSLSLISDALHNVGDGLGVLIAWIAQRVGNRPSNHKRTFGYKRIEILAALLNATILTGTTLYLFYEAVLRLTDPQPVKGLVMLTVASFGLLANVAALLLLRKGSGQNINIRAAYLHLLGDALSSIAVIIGGILIYFYNIFWVDPVITILIGLYILKAAFGILKEANDILMQGTPAGANLDQIRQDIESIAGIANIHHVHMWNLDDQSIHFECHMDLNEDVKLSETEKIHQQVEAILREKHNIAHLTIQFEYQWCEDKKMIHH